MRTRRDFLLGCSTAVAGLALAPGSSLAMPAAADSGYASLAAMGYELLAAQVNTRFRVRLSPSQAVEITLLKAPLARATPCVPGRPSPGDAGNQKFSLIFSGPKEAPLASAIHQFEHAQLGRFHMHLGQIGMEAADDVRYEAVFNQPAPAGSNRAAST